MSRVAKKSLYKRIVSVLNKQEMLKIILECRRVINSVEQTHLQNKELNNAEKCNEKQLKEMLLNAEGLYSALVIELVKNTITHSD
jgi:hypothetical protein